MNISTLLFLLIYSLPFPCSQGSLARTTHYHVFWLLTHVIIVIAIVIKTLLYKLFTNLFTLTFQLTEQHEKLKVKSKQQEDDLDYLESELAITSQQFENLKIEYEILKNKVCIHMFMFAQVQITTLNACVCNEVYVPQSKQYHCSFFQFIKCPLCVKSNTYFR